MSCSLHDVIDIESHGIPAVTVATEPFMNSAKAHALAYGRPDQQSAKVSHPLSGISREEVELRADEALSQIVAILTSTTPTNP